MWNSIISYWGILSFVLFNSILYYTKLFNSIQFYSILYYTILFYSTQFNSIQYYSIISCFLTFYSVLFCTFLYFSVLFCHLIENKTRSFSRSFCILVLLYLTLLHSSPSISSISLIPLYLLFSSTIRLSKSIPFNILPFKCHLQYLLSATPPTRAIFFWPEKSLSEDTEKYEVWK